MLRIMIADMSALFREGLTSLLQGEAGFQVVGEADAGQAALALSARVNPDAILMDTHLSDGSGIDAMRMILSCQPGISFIIFFSNESDELLIDAIRYGARGFLGKNISKSMLVSSLRALERGEAVVPRRMITRLMDEISRSGTSTLRSNSHLSILTYRELEVLKWLGNMSTNREIASHLFISENTVRVHVHSILDKLNLRNRREVADYVRHYRVFE